VILIISPGTDLHGRHVLKQLQARGERVQMVDTGRLGAGATMAFRVGARHDRQWTCVDQAPVRLSEVRTVWYRRSSVPEPPPEIRDPVHRSFVVREWKDAIVGLFSALDAWFVNEPLADAVAVKPVQLEMAQRAGLQIPDTLITNDASAALAFIEEHRHEVVHKTLSSIGPFFLVTEKWSPAHREQLEELSLAPTIFQEMISGGSELRITIVGDQIFAARFEPPPGHVDARLDYRIEYRPHELPRSVADSLLELMRSLGLVYGTVDMKLTDKGECYFLELNPSGQYLYVELLTKLPITDAMVALLRQRRPRQRPQLDAPSATGSDRPAPPLRVQTANLS
jgi:hypothetical protein